MMRFVKNVALRKCFMLLFIITFLVTSTGTMVYAQDSIQINNTSLTFNKVYYVDAVNGDDLNGDGSKTIPFKTFKKAYDMSAESGDAIYLIGVEGANYNDYKGAITKEIGVIGDGILSKMDFGTNSAFTSSTRPVKFYRVNITANELFRGSGSNSYAFYNCALKLDYWIVNYNTPAANLTKFYNCTLDASTTTYGAYRDDAYFENSIVFGKGTGFSQYGPSTLKTSFINDNFIENGTSIKTDTYSFVVDAIYNITGIQWKNKGTGTNPDGTQADIGVYGGEFAWLGQTQLPESPSNLVATAGDSKITLAWDAVTDVSYYNVKRSEVPSGPYTTVSENVYASNWIDTGVTNGNTYYYVVTAVKDGLESGNSNEVSATPQGTIVTPPPTGDKAILTITMINGVEKEYDLSMSKVLEFINWYESKGAGSPYFVFDKSFNLGPFKVRKDYIPFDKIASFEVNEYDVE